MLAKKAINALRIKLALAKLARAKRQTLHKLKTREVHWQFHSDPKLKPIKEFKPQTEVTYLREIRRNISWFLFGSTVNVFFYLVLVYQLKIQAFLACLLCILIGFLLTVAMPYSTTIQCLLFLVVPGFFTNKGRLFLIMYAFILIVNEPMENFNQNILVMTSAMTCGQEVANNQTEKLLSTALDPLSGILGGVESFITKVNHYSRMTKQAFLSMKKGMEEIVASINRLFSWLGNMVNVCNDKLLEPYQKCVAAFKVAGKECRQRVATTFVDLCHLVDIFKNICHLARIVDMICSITEIIKNLLQENFMLPVKNAVQNLHDMFYFKVTVTHTYQTAIEQTKSYSQVRDDVLQQVKEKFSSYLKNLKLFGVPTSLSIFLVIYKAVYFRAKYLSKNKFKNIYLSKLFYEIEKERELRGETTILPLKKVERKKYIDFYSVRLSSQERKKLIKELLFLWVSSFTIGFYLLCDYSLYWILDLIRSNLSVHVDKETYPHLKLQVKGNRPYADIFRSVVSLFDPLEDDDTFEKSKSCLPNPNEPNFIIYNQILAIFCFCLATVLIETYGLRLQHSVCGYFYPEREKERTHWLYFSILLNRGSLQKSMQQKVRHNYQCLLDLKKNSWKSAMESRFPFFKRLLRLWGRDTQFCCIICWAQGNADNQSHFERCFNERCAAVYCLECFKDIQNACVVCQESAGVGLDWSAEIDEEVDSSGDEEKGPSLEKPTEEILNSDVVEAKNETSESKTFAAASSHSELYLEKVFAILEINKILLNYELEPNTPDESENPGKNEPCP